MSCGRRNEPAEMGAEQLIEIGSLAGGDVAGEMYRGGDRDGVVAADAADAAVAISITTSLSTSARMTRPLGEMYEYV